MKEKTIFLIDMNSYFASIEQAANPGLKGKPVIVCGTGRTVVTTASYEARKYGIKTGMNLYEAKMACPHVINVTGNLQKYADTSRRIHQIFLKYTPLVEVFSIDECYLDVSCLARTGREPEKIAIAIKKEIKDLFKLTCSIGIGPNKIVAKVAAKLQKPDGLVKITQNDIPEKYWVLGIDALQGVGVGKKISEKLNALGIKTIKNLADTTITTLTSHFGVMGYYLKKAGLGEDDTPVRDYYLHIDAKSFGHSYTLPKDTSDTDIAKSYIRMLCEKVGTRLRKDCMMGRTISFYLRYGDFSSEGVHLSVKEYICSGEDIYKNALKMFGRFLPLKKPVRLLGVSLSSLMPYDNQQYILPDLEKKRKAVKIVDEINNRYGEFTIKPACVLKIKEYEEPCHGFSKHHCK